ncbi:hypothetical protein NV226_02340 [Mycoplasma iguanae]|uniref:Fibronectin type-III domain-containing protein n=1 Tax=Mycoplasma iguanae TaxID=292461 RepID=A0ABY5R7Q7_9MOLU|nr:hypothetical protein [Mycoplasma iguanae]UVD81546.1 hypothetical protein NV226_02340 [Mycoplasma iguanae]
MKTNKLAISLLAVGAIGIAATGAFVGVLAGKSKIEGGTIAAPEQPTYDLKPLPGRPVEAVDNTPSVFSNISLGNIDAAVATQSGLAEVTLTRLLPYVGTSIDLSLFEGGKDSSNLVTTQTVNPTKFSEKLIFNNLKSNTEYTLKANYKRANNNFEILAAAFTSKVAVNFELVQPTDSAPQGIIKLSNLNSYTNNPNEKLFVSFTEEKQAYSSLILAVDAISANHQWTKVIDQLTPGKKYSVKLFSVANGISYELASSAELLSVPQASSPTVISTFNNNTETVSFNLYGLASLSQKEIALEYRIKGAADDAPWTRVETDKAVASDTLSFELNTKDLVKNQEFIYRIVEKKVITTPEPTPEVSPEPAAPTETPASETASSAEAKPSETPSPDTAAETPSASPAPAEAENSAPAAEATPTTEPKTEPTATAKTVSESIVLTTDKVAATSTVSYEPLENVFGFKEFKTAVPAQLKVNVNTNNEAELLIESLDHYLGEKLKLVTRKREVVINSTEFLVTQNTFATTLANLEWNKEYQTNLETEKGTILSFQRFVSHDALSNLTAKNKVVETKVELSFTGGIQYQGQTLALSYRKSASTQESDWKTHSIELNSPEFRFQVGFDSGNLLEENTKYDWQLADLRGNVLLKGNFQTLFNNEAGVKVFGTNVLFEVKNTILNNKFQAQNKPIAETIFIDYAIDGDDKVNTLKMIIPSNNLLNADSPLTTWATNLKENSTYKYIIYTTSGLNKNVIDESTFSTTVKPTATLDQSATTANSLKFNVANLSDLSQQTIVVEYEYSTTIDSNTTATKLTKEFEITDENQTLAFDYLKANTEYTFNISIKNSPETKISNFPVLVLAQGLKAKTSAASENQTVFSIDFSEVVSDSKFETNNDKLITTASANLSFINLDLGKPDKKNTATNTELIIEFNKAETPNFKNQVKFNATNSSKTGTVKLEALEFETQYQFRLLNKDNLALAYQTFTTPKQEKENIIISAKVKTDDSTKFDVSIENLAKLNEKEVDVYYHKAKNATDLLTTFSKTNWTKAITTLASGSTDAAPATKVQQNKLELKDLALAAGLYQFAIVPKTEIASNVYAYYFLASELTTVIPAKVELKADSIKTTTNSIAFTFTNFSFYKDDNLKLKYVKTSELESKVRPTEWQSELTVQAAEEENSTESKEVVVAGLESGTSYTFALVNSNNEILISDLTSNTLSEFSLEVRPAYSQFNLSLKGLNNLLKDTTEASSEISYKLEVSEKADFSEPVKFEMNFLKPSELITKAASNKNSNINVDLSLKGLDPGKTYFFRLVNEGDATKAAVFNISGLFSTLDALSSKVTEITANTAQISVANLSQKALQANYAGDLYISLTPKDGSETKIKVDLATLAASSVLNLTSLEADKEYTYKFFFEAKGEGESTTKTDVVGLSGSFKTSKITSSVVSLFKSAKVTFNEIEAADAKKYLLKYGRATLDQVLDAPLYDANSKKLTFDLTGLEPNAEYKFELVTVDGKSVIISSFKTLKEVQVSDSALSDKWHQIKLVGLESFIGLSESLKLEWRKTTDSTWQSHEFKLGKRDSEITYTLTGLIPATQYQYKVTYKPASYATDQPAETIKALSTFTTLTPYEENRSVTTEQYVKVNVDSQEKALVTSVENIYATSATWQNEIKKVLTQVYVSAGNKADEASGSLSGYWIAVNEKNFENGTENSNKVTYKHIWSIPIDANSTEATFYGIEIEFSLENEKIYALAKSAKSKKLQESELKPLLTNTEELTKKYDAATGWSNLTDELTISSDITGLQRSARNYNDEKVATVGGFRLKAIRTAISAADQNKILNSFELLQYTAPVVAKKADGNPYDLPALPGFGETAVSEKSSLAMGKNSTILGSMLEDGNLALANYGINSLEEVKKLFAENDQLKLHVVSTKNGVDTDKWLSAANIKVFDTSKYNGIAASSYAYIWKDGNTFNAVEIYLFSQHGMVLLQQKPNTWTRKILANETLETLTWENFIASAITNPAWKVSSTSEASESIKASSNSFSLKGISFGQHQLAKPASIVQPPFSKFDYSKSVYPPIAQPKTPEAKDTPTEPDKTATETKPEDAKTEDTAVPADSGSAETAPEGSSDKTEGEAPASASPEASETTPPAAASPAAPTDSETEKPEEVSPTPSSTESDTDKTPSPEGGSDSSATASETAPTVTDGGSTTPADASSESGEAKPAEPASSEATEESNDTEATEAKAEESASPKAEDTAAADSAEKTEPAAESNESSTSSTGEAAAAA